MPANGKWNSWSRKSRHSNQNVPEGKKFRDIFIAFLARRQVESRCKPCGNPVENREEGRSGFPEYSTVFSTIHVESGGGLWIVEIRAKSSPRFSSRIPLVQNSAACGQSEGSAIFHQFHTPYCCYCPYLIIIIIFIWKIYLLRQQKKFLPGFPHPMSKNKPPSIFTICHL